MKKKTITHDLRTKEPTPFFSSYEHTYKPENKVSLDVTITRRDAYNNKSVRIIGFSDDEVVYLHGLFERIIKEEMKKG